ncbi:synemin [Emydura macquarii macquarii]|uniref:synemin n=1 Tax=Emydura macquarii macquarii TaxID=1129001 RepID=UPI00352A881D
MRRSREEAWDEKSQLRELNSRLRLYVCRVRQLEQENRLLAQELAGLQEQELALELAGRRGAQQELAGLRVRLGELSRAQRAAELERDGLRQELGRLQRLGAEVLELRRRLAPDLAGQRQLLERRWGECAALEELLAGLRAEQGRLLERQRREAGEARALRLQLVALPAPPPAGASLEQLEETYELVLGRACRESLLRYQSQLGALREREARLGGESLEQRRAEAERCRRQLDELRRRGEELGGLGQRLEQELLALRERHGAEADEYQRIIDTLEEEKQFLTMSITDYLKDYHELMQVKAGLSLEVATYRALLEEESSQWIITWVDQQGRKIPQGVRNTSYDYINSHSAYREENKKKSFPIIKSADTRYKTPVTNICSSALYSAQTTRGGPHTTDSGKVLRKNILSSGYHPSTIEKDATYQRTMKDHREFKTFTPTYGLWEDTEIQRKTFPERKRTEATSTSAVSLSKELTSVQSSNKDHKVDVKSGVSESTRTKPDNFTKFPSNELNSNFKQIKYEQTLDDTFTTSKEKPKRYKPVKEGENGLLEEKDKKQPVNEERYSVLEKKEMDAKLTTAERSVHFGKKTEIKPEQKTHIMEEVIINDNKNIFSGVRSKEDSTAEEERNATWEEQTKVHKSAREGEFFLPDVKITENELTKRNTNVFLESRSKEAVEIPISVEMYTPDKVLQNSNTEITFQGFKTSVGRETDEHNIKPVEILSVNVAEREPKLKDEHGIHDKSSPRMGTSSTENIAETIVADILKSFVQSSGSETTPDTKVNYLEKKEHDDKQEMTEITAQCQVQEDTEISDEIDLGSLLNKDVKVVLEGAKGIPSKEVIEDIIKVGLKGRDSMGKVSVNVEIVEEPLESATDERSEFSTPFEVEEVEDTSPGIQGHYGDEEEQKITVTAEDFKKKKPSEILTHVEEVTEADDSVDEQKYFVSTPDDYPLAHGKDDDSVCGQIHIEEESTIKYSWQDEFLQGTQRRKDVGMSSPEQTYQVVGEEASAYVLNEEHPKGEASHAESTVIEKEIKIPHEFQTSIKGLLLKETQDPKQQLKEALEQLEGSLPESVKEELAVLTKEGQGESSSLAVDIKKVEQTNKGGLVTIVAEVNLSQTLDADQFDIAQLGGVIPSEMEKISLQSLKQEGFDERNDQQLDSCTDGKSSIEIDISPSSNKSTPWASREVYSSSRVRNNDGMEYHSTEQVICEGPVSEAVEFGNAEEVSQSHVSTDINKSIRHIKIGPTEIRRTEQVIYEGPISETLELVGREDLVQTEGSSDIGRFMKHFKLGPQEIQTTEEIIHKGPITKTLEVGEPENFAQPRFSTDINRSMRNVTLGSKQITEEIIFKGPIAGSELSSSGDLSHAEESTDTNRSVRHIRLSPKEFHTEQVIFEGPISGNVELSGTGDLSQTGSSIRHIKLGQNEIHSVDKIVYEGPLSETVELVSTGDSSHMEHRLDTNASIRHIRLGPKEFMTTEQIIYKGPISGHLELSESGDNFDSEESIKHITLGQKEIKTAEQVIYQGSISESAELSSAGGSLLESEENSDINRSIRLIKLSPTETHTEQIIFKGPISETKGDHFQTEELSESSRSIRHIKLGPKETSFTFQMDVTNVAGAPVVEGGTQEAIITVSNREDSDVSHSQVIVESDQKDTDNESNKEASVFPDSSQAYGEQITEKSVFEKSVQLQRMVDQRSMISDEKKIALVYLDKEEEEGEDNDGHWF